MGIHIGLGLNSKSATSGATGAAPEISGESYDPVADKLTLNVSEPVTLYALHNASATPLTAAAIESGAEVTQALAAGIGYVDWNDYLWGAGTWYLHVAVEDADGLTDTITPIEHIRPIPGFTETWAAYAVGNTFAELAADYDRTAGGLFATIVADAAAPDGKACAIESSTANERYMWHKAIKAALGLRTTERIQFKALLRMASLANGRGMLGYTRDTGNLNTGVTVSKSGSTWSIGCQLEGNPSSLSNNVVALTGLADGDLVRVICEIDGLDIKVKAYRDGDPEPGSWTTQTYASAIVFPEFSLGARVTGIDMYVLGYTLAIGADAPEV